MCMNESCIIGMVPKVFNYLAVNEPSKPLENQNFSIYTWMHLPISNITKMNLKITVKRMISFAVRQNFFSDLTTLLSNKFINIKTNMQILAVEMNCCYWQPELFLRQYRKPAVGNLNNSITISKAAPFPHYTLSKHPSLAYNSYTISKSNFKPKSHNAFKTETRASKLQFLQILERQTPVG